MDELRIAAQDDGERLDRVLAGVLGSRSRAQRLIEAGLVAVAGEPATKRRLVRAGELVTWEPEPAPAAAPDVGPVPYAVAYEDADLMVIDKPAGVVVHPAPGTRGPTLSEALASRGALGGDPWRPGIVHRLDRDTSGLLVVAKSQDAHRALKRQIEKRDVLREYLALVVGCPPARSGTIDAPLGRDRRRRTLHSTDTNAPRNAVTHFEIEEALPAHALLRVRLETGRTHQIRAHLEAIGHPVAGDPDYGARGELGLSRQFLHAARLAFDHPSGSGRVDVSSPLPADLVAALERAR